MDRRLMGPNGEGSRNSEGENLLGTYNRNVWMIGSNWFQKRGGCKITHHSFVRSFGTVVDYFILTRNLWNIVNDVKGIPGVSFEGDHRIVIADFRKVAE
jgi:hypothetical protein